ncbi:MAG: hypothetical protein CFH29_00482 [Alphaproteobacteria bacterium MarineAlpha7_Bin1]|nr:MAG: hypothetical protein CFH29_00482 [Alphaproteobacteria bacterium MarineAlpha7_Bin1]|tara:strand:- start:76 stop:366 length:291 start_codon:yes stop_codon:yes gene_type:complete
MKKLRDFFKVDSNIRLLIVFIVFSVAGSLSLVVADNIFSYLLEFEDHDSLYWFFRIIILFPIYQVLLIVTGTIFGEFRYFWEIEKRILKRLGFKLK